MSETTEQPAGATDEAAGGATDRAVDEEMDASETPADVATRMAPQLRLIQLGCLAALLAVGTAVVALIDYPADAGTDVWFPVGVLVAAALLLAIGLVQLVVWRRAFADWRVDRAHDGGRSVRLSWWLHWLSYPVLLAGLYLCIEASALGGFSDLPGFALGIGALLLIVAQITAGVQFLRTDGGAGTVPNHLRRLMARIQALR